MKRFITGSLFILLSMVPLACNKPFSTPIVSQPLSQPLITPTSTPQPSVPSCIWTPLPFGDLVATTSGTYVIQNSTEWNSANFSYPTTIPTPAPPVNFNQWMVVGVGTLYECGVPEVVFTSICTYPNYIEVTYASLPTPIPTPGAVVVTCNEGNTGTILAALPQSNLPVFFNSTPTPTATP